MGKQVQLQAILEEILGSEEVHFQPPSSLKMTYPAIVYEVNTDAVRKADDKLYSRKIKYTVTVIDADPTTEIPAKIAEMLYTKMNRAFTANNLNHYVFNIYF